MESNSQPMSLNELEENLFTLFPKLNKAKEKPAVHNPFKSDLKYNKWEIVRSALLCFLIPIRMSLLALILLGAGILSKVFLIGHRESEPAVPMTGFRKLGQTLIWYFARAASIVNGFHHVPVKGRFAGSKEAPLIICAPHSTFVDGFSFLPLGNVSAVSRSENLDVPVLGNYIRLIQPAIVDRRVKDSRQMVCREIQRRAEEGNWPPIIIFPEGTTTNHQCLIKFKQGGFAHGLPVQPLLLRFPDKQDYASWTWMGPNAFWVMCAMMSRFNNNMSLEVLPVYTPSDEERKNPFLYADNVRKYMAHTANLPVTDHSFEDCQLMQVAKRHGMPMESGLVEYYKLTSLTGLNIGSMLEHFERFASIDSKKDGVIDLEEFCHYLMLPSCKEVKTIFRIFRIDGNESMSFREYLLALLIISNQFNTDFVMREVFKGLDRKGGGYFNVGDLADYFSSIEEITHEYLEKIVNTFSQLTGKVDYEKFKEACLHTPPLILLLNHLRAVRSQQNMTSPMTSTGCTQLKNRKNMTSSPQTSASLCSVDV